MGLSKLEGPRANMDEELQSQSARQLHSVRSSRVAKKNTVRDSLSTNKDLVHMID